MHRFASLLCLMFAQCFAQDSLTIQQYIDHYKNAAIAEMQRTGVPAAITLAQGIHESAAGTSPLVQESNNHFGIKCKTGWTGESVLHDDDRKGECFRKYSSPQDSYTDHSNFLRANQRYAFLFDYDPLNYEAWAKGLKQAGYATNPRYPQLIIHTIERFHLNELTLLALDQTVQPGNADVAGNTIQQHAPAATIIQPAVLIETTPATTISQTANTNPGYPSGVFTINNCKVVYAEKGTSLLALAIQHHISLNNLLSWNDMSNVDILDAGQLIFLEKKPKKSRAVYHEVKPGETLWQISQQEGIRLASLIQYNGLADNAIPRTGSKLLLN